MIAVGYSGGRDSTALLHATLAAAAGSRLTVAALHVHHGLSRHADEWSAHCEAQCAAWSSAPADPALVFASARVAGRPPRGASVEAWAREQRYRALRKLAADVGASAVLLGHHRRDQAETVLLQALRGAGPAGLAAMPTTVARDGIVWLRPWLHRSRDDIDAYVRHHRLEAVEDDGNADPRFARNRLRRDVWPAFVAAFPGAEASLARSAAWAAEAASALDELAALDLADVARDGRLDLAAWLALSPARRGLVVRAWLRAVCGPATVPASLTRRLLAELPSGGAGGGWQVPGGRLHRHRGTVRFVPAGVGAEPTTPASPPPPARETGLSVSGAGVFPLPGWRARLVVTAGAPAGVPLALLGRLELRPRRGAERFQLGPGRPPRSLKKQFQAAAVPAWLRDGPLLYGDGRLVFVPGLGIDARVVGRPGDALVDLAWQPDAAPDSA